MSEHWGEFVEKSDSPSSDRMDYGNLLAKSDFLLSSYKPLSYSDIVSPPVIKLQEEDELNSLQTSVKGGMVEHSIQLEKYRSQLHTLLGTAVQSIGGESGLSLEQTTPELAEVPSFPVCVDCYKNQSSAGGDDLEPHDRNFASCVGLAPVVITTDTCNHLLRKSIAQICLHQGYTESVPSALNALTGSCQVFFSKLLTQLRYNTDLETTHGYSGFQDAMHRTLAQIGQGDVSSLLADYHRTTVQRHDSLLSTCRDLEKTYSHIRSTGEIPDQFADILSSLQRDSNPSVFSLSDNEERSEIGSSAVDADEALGDDDDAQTLLELAGLSGFDITIAEQEDGEEAAMAAAEILEASGSLAVGPTKPKSKPKSKAKGGAAASKRRKKH